MFNFLHIRFCELQKHGINNTMKKMLLATALALLITGCAQQTFTVQNKPAAVAVLKGNAFTHHFVSPGIGKKTVDAQICGGGKMLLKQKPSKISANGLLGFITLGIYICCTRVYCSLNTARVAHRYGQLYLHCSLIYRSFQLFLHSDQPLRVK